MFFTQLMLVIYNTVTAYFEYKEYAYSDKLHILLQIYIL